MSTPDGRNSGLYEPARADGEPQPGKAVRRCAHDVLEAAYRDLGFQTERLPREQYGNHLIANLPGGEGPRVLFVGHADTVFPLGTLTTMPMRREGDRLLGPGVVDMKGGLVVMLYAIQALLSLRGSLKGSLRVVVNSDEEPGSPTSRISGQICVRRGLGFPSGACPVGRRTCASP